MNRWFRMYDELLDNPKVQRLSGDDFKAWVNVLCLASRGDGFLPPIEDIAFALRIEGKKAATMFGRLAAAGLVVEIDGRFQPNKWNERQYKSDVSTDRVKRFRQRSKPVSETVDETAPETDTDTDTSVAKATGDEAPPPDPEKVMFDAGVRLLGEDGHGPKHARSLIGKWRKDHSAGEVIEALGAAQRMGITDKVGWIEGRWRSERLVNGRASEMPLC